MARAAAAGIVKLGATGDGGTVASAPAVSHDAATSPLVIAARTMPPNAATVSARTRTKAGSAGVSAVRAARAIPRKAGAPEVRAAPRSSQRSTSGYSRNTTITAGTAMSTGAALE